MPKTTFFKIFQRWFIRRFWPWFRDVVWPIVKDEVVAIFRAALERSRMMIDEWLDRRSARQQADLHARADEAEQEASRATDQAEIKRLSALAEERRRMADQLLRENEELKKEISSLMSQVADEAKANLDTLPLEVQIDQRQPELTVGRHAVPLLSEPDEGGSKPPRKRHDETPNKRFEHRHARRGSSQRASPGAR